MEENLEMMFLSNLLHQNHEHHVLVNRLGSFAEYRGTLKLIRSHLIMSCLKKNSELVCFCLKILHE